MLDTGGFTLAASGKVEDLQPLEYIIAMGTGTASFDGDNSTSKIVYLVKWESHRSFIDYLLGYSTYGTLGSNPSNLYRELPEPHPEYLSQWATRVDISPEGFDEERRRAGQAMIKTEGALSSQGVITANICRINCTYQSLPFNLTKDEEYVTPEYNRYTYVEPTFNVETISATGRMQFCSGNKTALDVPPPIYASVIAKNVTWYDIPADPNNEFVPCNWYYMTRAVGRINTTAFMGDPAGTVLFMSPKCVPHKASAVNGNKSFDVTMPFQVKNNGFGFNYFLTSGARNMVSDAQRPDVQDDWAGWNYFYNQNLGANNRFDLMTHDANQNGKRVFYDYEFNNLFKLLETPI